MANNGVGLTGSIVHAPEVKLYEYRNGTGMMPSAEWFVFHDDFCTKVASNVPTGWEAAIIDTGATVTIDTATAGLHTSSLMFDSDGAGEGAAIYLPKTFQLVPGKKFWMEARVQHDTGVDCDFYIGLSDLTATTNPEDLWTTTSANVVAFGIDVGTSLTGILVDAGNSGTTRQAGTQFLSGGNTWQRIAISYDGAKVRGYINGKLSVVWGGAGGTIPTSVALAPFIGYRNGSSAANEAWVDYIRVVAER